LGRKPLRIPLTVKLALLGAAAVEVNSSIELQISHLAITRHPVGLGADA
jgi:hypothetical protein